MEQSPSSSEAKSHSASQEIPRLLWTRRFIAVFKRALHYSLSWGRWIQSINSQPIIFNIHSNILPSIPRICMHFSHPPCLRYIILHDLITLTLFSEAYNLRSSSMCTPIQLLATASLLGTNISIKVLPYSSVTLQYNICKRIVSYFRHYSRKFMWKLLRDIRHIFMGEKPTHFEMRC